MNPSHDDQAATRRFEPHESFFDAQRRNRRATWRMSVLCLFAVLILGIPLTLVITPLVYAGTLIVADIVNYFSPLPPEFWQSVHVLARLAVRVGDFLFNHKLVDPEILALGALVVLVPGIVISLFLWLGLVALLRRGGVGGALLSINAREPSRSDLKELQVADVVEEMAIAAGLPAPRVMLVDAPVANAAAIGTSPADARVVVSRRLLDDLNRDELEGVLAHLVASIGNGDLKIAFLVTSVFETCGLLVTLINSPFGGQARGTVWRILRYGFARPGDDAGRAREAEAVADLLNRYTNMATSDIDQFFNSSSQKPSFIKRVLRFIFFPIFFTNAAIEITLWFFTFAVVGPSIALLWRTRQYLADAGAVQFTRNPDGLASGLEKLNADGGAFPGGEWAWHLFIVSPGRGDRMSQAQPTAEQAARMASAWAATAKQESAPAPGSAPVDFARLRAEITDTQRAAFHGDAQAMARLVAFGRAMSAASSQPLGNIPDPADIIAALHRDPAAIARLRARSRQESAQVQGKKDMSSTGLQSKSFLSFHPPLKRRLKRLQRMGAHVLVESLNKRTIKFAVFIGVILTPLFALLIGLFLVLIAMMAMLNLIFLGIWLAAIHAIFTLLAGHH